MENTNKNLTNTNVNNNAKSRNRSKTRKRRNWNEIRNKQTPKLQVMTGYNNGQQHGPSTTQQQVVTPRVIPQQIVLQPVQVMMPEPSIGQLQQGAAPSQMMLQQQLQARQQPMARKHLVSERYTKRGIQHNFITPSRFARPTMVYSPYTHSHGVVFSQGPGTSNVQCFKCLNWGHKAHSCIFA